MIPNYNLTDQVPQQFIPQQQTVVPPVMPMREEIKRVNGINGAKEYQKNLAPNSNAVVFDNDKDVFYLVMKDANGISPEQISYGEFTMHKEESKEDTYATKDDLNKVLEEIRKLSEVLK